MKFSIIIAVAPERNAEVVSSLNNLDYRKSDYEIIIKKSKNPSRNRNDGAKEAKGEILAFVDDDAIVPSNWLRNAEEFFKYDIDILGGPQLTPRDDNFFAKTSGYVIESFFASANMSKRYKKGKVKLNANESDLTSANCFVKKEVFEKLNGFDLNLFPGEDPDFFTRAKENGFKLAYNPNLFVYHRRRNNFSGYCKQVYSYGYVRTKIKRSLLHFIPSAFFVYMCLLPVLYFISWLFLVPLGLYFVITIPLSLFISIRKLAPLSFPLLPFLFFFWHISYGLGFLVASVRFK